MFRNINKIDELANHFNNVSLKYAEKIKGFDLNKNLCMTYAFNGI
jgi:hypothetical protein